MFLSNGKYYFFFLIYHQLEIRCAGESRQSSAADVGSVSEERGREEGTGRGGTAGGAGGGGSGTGVTAAATGTATKRMATIMFYD